MFKCGKYGAKTREKITVTLLNYFLIVQFTVDSLKKTQSIHYNKQIVKLLTRKAIV